MDSISSNSSGYTIGLRENTGDAAQQQRLMVGTATTGLVRVEWIQARYGQVFPTNWSWVQAWQNMAPGTFMPLNYQVDDAQNLICNMAIKGEYEWLLLYEHDMLPAPDTMVRLSGWMKRADTPVVSALYFTRSIPSEPLIYRGRGTLSYENFDLGDVVQCDGVGTGMLLIHMSIIRAMWEESEEYTIGGTTLRRIFETPVRAWFDPESAEYNTQAGTSDLAWCKRVMDEGFLAKAGWLEHQDMQYPFVVDTNIQCNHINTDMTGEVFPPGGVRAYWTAIREQHRRDNPPTLGINVTENLGMGDSVG